MIIKAALILLFHFLNLKNPMVQPNIKAERDKWFHATKIVIEQEVKRKVQYAGFGRVECISPFMLPLSLLA
jgi:hypothetical protein